MILSNANSLLEDIKAAKAAGYTSEFMYRNHRLYCRTNEVWYEEEDCFLVEYCRHEGMNDPGDSSILFLIECNDGVRGCLTSPYGKDADPDLIQFVLNLQKIKP